MLRTAFVGTGWWGGELARAAATLRERIAIAGFYSLDDAACRRLSGQHGAPVLPSWEEILRDPEIEAVVLATPHSQHAPQVIAAAQAGKHVFVEKPLALDVRSARKAHEACAKAKRVLAVGHNRRLMPGMRKLRELLPRCGRIIHVEAHYSGDLMMRLPAGHWRLRRAEMPAAGMAPMGLHLADAVQWLLGPVARVAAIVKRQAAWANGADVDDTCAALFELADGATGTLASHLATPAVVELRIYGTQGRLEARGDPAAITRFPASVALLPGGETWQFEGDPSVTEELSAFAEACAGRAPYPIAAEEAIRNVALMQAMQASSDRGGAWISVRA
ncbi:MAG TPA: Gfo/Idh/MocA family oxidoreductase [Burkholderiales bacterium]|nr:Gfo/Idh/MocA family oxidoreductase [Burkholderiales bacterium]